MTKQEEKKQGKKLNIYQKILAIQNEIETVSKSTEVGKGKNAYKVAIESDVLAAVKPLEAKYGVFSYPENREVVDAHIIETVDQYGNIKKSIYQRMKTTYIFLNVDNPEERVETITYSDGIDPGDKGNGKAMTYGDKYALMKVYKIQTGEDLDKEVGQQLPEPERIVKNKSYLIEALAKARSSLTGMVDIRTDKANEWICATYNIPTQDDTKLTIKQINSLLEAYRYIYAAKRDGQRLIFEAED